MRKCLIIYLLLLSMVSLMLPVGAASENAVFNIRVPSELPKADNEFEVAVELTNNPGFYAIEFTLSYNTSIMECVSVITDGALNGVLSVTNPKAKDGAVIAAASLKTLAGDGPVAIYSFKAKEDITLFDFKLKNVSLVGENNTDIKYEVAGNSDNTATGTVPPAVESDSDSENIDEQPLLTFPDVAGHWAEEYIGEAVKHGLFIGDTEGNFNPDDNVTRAQFITVLWRMAGKTDADAEIPFTDTEELLPEFKKAIAWGYASGHINGTSETTFEPNATLTREAGMKILHSYSGGKVGKEIQLYAVYDGLFKDSAEISAWAKSSLYWGVYNKMISGTSADTLSPKGTATRAQLAKILVDYINFN